jgi:hypothetical protein
MPQNLMMLLMHLTFLTNVNRDDSAEYWACIQNHSCIHDKEDLTKLSKDEYIITMQCRVKRHLDCIRTEMDMYDKKTCNSPTNSK